ncbi:hypothetical protein ANN_24711 [Periplaneta americana]|uniref:Endonuclease/exonuclease/phosphatase domain-containing protein n=1 Tax=Periplaneta americana TaxID=6978 RepID=A0ABQ8RZI0_PERAM|nr:hypothetical protein ANN_24711 [Periplaneta americana]
MRTYTSGHRRKRAAVIVNNKDIDVTTIRQISDEDCIVVEVNYKKKVFFASSMYFDRVSNIEEDIRKAERILTHIKGRRLLILADTNVRNKLWYDNINNERGRLFEEFLTINTLHILNENTEIPSYETARGRSWIDLTITNNILLGHITDWKIAEEESCSDHRIISFKIGEVNRDKTSIYHRA